MEKNSGAAPAPAPAPAPATGCYKCGRPGHWSRDCPFSKSDSNPIPTTTNPNSNPPRPYFKPTNFPSTHPIEKTAEKPKKPPKIRPKLTPELLLSEDGLGYVLRHFPKSFKFHGRGHEVNDLGNLIELYTEWHSRLIPYYSFEQFVHKVEQVGATRRVRTCLRDLRERVANGGDPSKLHEPPVEGDATNLDAGEAINEDVILDNGNLDNEIPLPESHDVDALEEEMADEIFTQATEEPLQFSETHTRSDDGTVKELPDQVSGNGASVSTVLQITEEQKARMEANRLKALERAAARSRSSQAE